MNKTEIIIYKTEKNKNCRQWHICDDDLIIALNKMSDKSIEYIIKQSLSILKERKSEK
jgi:hypothetical protein